MLANNQALIAAWKAACKVNGASVQIPSGFKFLIKPITLQGPCMPDLVLQVTKIYLSSSIQLCCLINMNKKKKRKRASY